MKRYSLALFLALACSGYGYAQQPPEILQAASQAAPGQAPLLPQHNALLPDGMAQQNPNERREIPVQEVQPAAQEVPLEENASQKNKNLRLAASAKELEQEETDLAQDALAVYIDIEEVFNKNPWTLQARRNMRLDLEAKQLEYARMQTQLQELNTKQKNLEEELAYYKSFYQPDEFIEPSGAGTFPRIPRDDLNDVLSMLVFSSSDMRVSSPENMPHKIERIKEAIKDTKTTIYDRQHSLLNYKAVSRQEVLSRQDYIVQEVLKEIYSAIKEYAAVRNIGVVVDKKELVYGKPLNVTNEFIKWMKSYHKKYVKEHGDIL